MHWQKAPLTSGFGDHRRCLATGAGVCRAGQGVAPLFEPERVKKVVTPVDVFSPAPGVWTFDLGEMITGAVEWQVPDDLPAGAEVVFRYGQELRRQGSHFPGIEWHYPPGNQTTNKSRLLSHYTDMGVVINIGQPPIKELSHIPCDLYASGGAQGAVWRSSESHPRLPLCRSHRAEKPTAGGPPQGAHDPHGQPAGGYFSFVGTRLQPFP